MPGKTRRPLLKAKNKAANNVGKIRYVIYAASVVKVKTEERRRGAEETAGAFDDTRLAVARHPTALHHSK